MKEIEELTEEEIDGEAIGGVPVTTYQMGMTMFRKINEIIKAINSEPQEGDET